MPSLGETLRRARVEQGLDIAAVAARTKIGPRYLAAIEADDPKSLPGTFFYRNFVHQYASALSVPLEALEDELSRVAGEDAPLAAQRQAFTPVVDSMAVAEGRRFQSRPLLWSFGFLVVVLLGCSGIYEWWNKAARTPAVSAPSQAPVPAVQVATPPPAPSPAASAPAAGKIELHLTATSDTWVSAQSDGRRVFSEVLRAHENKAVSATDGLKLTLGNAAGVDVLFNGKPIGPVGPPNQVRVVVFKRDGFQILAPAGKTGA